MGVRFDAGARRSIVAATIEAEKHGRSRPLPADLLAGLMSLPESPVPAAVAGLGADARNLIAAAMAPGAHPAAHDMRGSTPEDAERILKQAADIAAGRGTNAEVGILDILAAALASFKAPADPRRASGSGSAQAASISTSGANHAHAGVELALTTRAGIGYDSHRFGDSGQLVLGGVVIPDCVRLVGHSDGDAIAHAITDAILGAANAGDIGEMFSDQDPANRGRDSLQMLGAAVQRAAALGFAVHQVDATVVAERPKIAPYREAMKTALAAAMRIPVDRVSVKGKTNEGMGWVGRGEGIACIAVATLATASAR